MALIFKYAETSSLFKQFQVGAIGYIKAKSMPNNFIAPGYYLENDKKAVLSQNVLF